MEHNRHQNKARRGLWLGEYRLVEGRRYGEEKGEGSRKLRVPRPGNTRAGDLMADPRFTERPIITFLENTLGEAKEGVIQRGGPICG